MPAEQLRLDSLGTALSATTFVVVDLETTGGSAASDGITEIGAVKVRGGEHLGEFRTFVDPGRPVPPFIAVLTGITDRMLAGAPPVDVAVPAFLDWAGDCVLVAHNAPFDLGFLRAACERGGRRWPAYDSVDTARLARRVLTRDEAPDCRLGTLARILGAATTPCHRALDDARATVDVLHSLFERLGPLGVTTREELRTFTGMATASQRRKRHLAEPLPTGPGVYVFRDHAGRALYIGRSRHVRTRVRQYFTASEPRTRMAEMVGIAERVDAIPCAHPLEAEVRELRLIAEHKPRYNRRSRFPERSSWLKLTDEAFPRLSLVRRVVDDGATYLGPFSTTRAATAAMTAVYDAVPLRQCTARLRPLRRTAACVLAGLGRCVAPCEGTLDAAGYAPVAATARALLTGQLEAVTTAADRRIAALVAQRRYESAGEVRDRAAGLVRAVVRMQRLAALAACSQLVAAGRSFDGGWEIAVVRHGRLAAAAASDAGADPWPTVRAATASAETVVPDPGPLAAATAEEMERILAWLDRPDVRLVALTGDWTSPTSTSATARQWLVRAEAARESARVTSRPLADRRGLRPLHRPTRGEPTPVAAPVRARETR